MLWVSTVPFDRLDQKGRQRNVRVRKKGTTTGGGGASGGGGEVIRQTRMWILREEWGLKRKRLGSRDDVSHWPIVTNHLVNR